MSDGQFRLGATFDDFERFKVILEATEPGGHGAAWVPARAEALLVVRSKHVALNAVDQPR